MIFLSSQDVERLGVDYAVANTPSYVYRRFRDDPMVKALALRSDAELVDALGSADAVKNPSEDRKIEAYAAAIGLLISSRQLIVERYLRENTDTCLSWLRGILEYSLSLNRTGIARKVISGRDYRIDLESRPIVSTTNSSMASSTVVSEFPSGDINNNLIVIGNSV